MIHKKSILAMAGIIVITGSFVFIHSNVHAIPIISNYTESPTFFSLTLFSNQGVTQDFSQSFNRGNLWNIAFTVSESNFNSGNIFGSGRHDDRITIDGSVKNVVPTGGGHSALPFSFFVDADNAPTNGVVRDSKSLSQVLDPTRTAPFKSTESYQGALIANTRHSGFFRDDITSYSWTITGGLLTATGAPEPSTLIMLGSGILGLVGLRRKQPIQQAEAN